MKARFNGVTLDLTQKEANGIIKELNDIYGKLTASKEVENFEYIWKLKDFLTIPEN